MPEIQYKFKSSIVFETFKFDEPKITLGALRDLINQKQSFKQSAFDFKFTDSDGKVYSEDNETIEPNSKIIVSRLAKCEKSNSVKKAISTVKVLPTITSTPKPVEIIVDVAKDVNDVLEKTEEPVEVSKYFEIPEILRCPICKDLIKDAMITNCCQMNYCHECITGYMFDPEISGSMDCHNCKSSVSKQSSLRENVQLRNLINDFKLGKSIIDISFDTIKQEQYQNSTSTNNIVIPVESKQFNADEDFVQNEVECVTTEIDEVFDEHSSQSEDFNNGGNELFLRSSSVERNVILRKEDDDNNSVTGDDSLDLHNVEIVADQAFLDECDWQDADIQQMQETTEKRTDKSYRIVDECTETDPIPISDVRQQQQLINQGSYQQSQNEALCNNTSEIPASDSNKSNNKSYPADSWSKVNIKSLEFDPVLYMKFLKIVGDKYPDELRKILSTETKLSSPKTSSLSTNRKPSSKRRSSDDTQSKSVTRKVMRYESDSDDQPKRKKPRTPITAIDKHPDVLLKQRYESASMDNRTGDDFRSRSREYHSRKQHQNGFSGVRRNGSGSRSRNAEPIHREYYQSNASSSRYRSAQQDVPIHEQQQQYYDDRRNKYRSDNYQYRMKPKYNSRPADR